jgi:hypothetical protein
MSLWNEDPEGAAPATPEQIREAEERLGVTLPACFRELWAARNGGVPARTILRPPASAEVSDNDLWPLKEVHALADLEDLESLGEDGWAPDDTFEGTIPDATALICFAQQGARFWCLDYRACGPTGEPCVQFVCADHDGEPREVRLAESAQAFLDCLIVEED